MTTVLFLIKGKGVCLSVRRERGTKESRLRQGDRFVHLHYPYWEKKGVRGKVSEKKKGRSTTQSLDQPKEWSKRKKKRRENCCEKGGRERKTDTGVPHYEKRQCKKEGKGGREFLKKEKGTDGER